MGSPSVAPSARHSLRLRGAAELAPLPAQPPLPLALQLRPALAACVVGAVLGE